MRKKYLAVVFLLVHYCGYGQDFFRLTGKIENLDNTDLSFTYYPDWVSSPIVYNFVLSKENTFVIEFPIKEMGYCDVSFGEHALHLMLIEPGDALNLYVDNEDFYNTLRVDGHGAAKWQYQFKLLNMPLETDLAKLNNYQWPAYSNRIQHYLVQKMDLLNSTELDQQTHQILKADLVGEYTLKKIGYLNYHKLSTDSLTIKWNEFDGQTKSKSISFGRLAEEFINSKNTDKRIKSSRTLDYEFIKRYKEEIGQELAERVLANKLSEYMAVDGGTEELKFLVEDYGRFAQNDDFKKYLTLNIRKKAALVPGVLAANFVAKNKKGKFSELEDYRGKNIFLGFYESDCSLCQADFEAIKNVMGFHKNRRDLIFLFINLSNPDNFKYFIKSNKPPGIHLNAYDNKFLESKYNVLELPNYLMIDKSGKILTTNIEEPHSDEGRGMIELVNRLLGKQ